VRPDERAEARPEERSGNGHVPRLCESARRSATERALALDEARLLDAYRARDALRGSDVTWATGRGRAAGIDGEGRLVVELPEGGRTALSAGEVHLLGEG
jgi:biotin-(acetyl-CoA carboxylase) ligase